MKQSPDSSEVGEVSVLIEVDPLAFFARHSTGNHAPLFTDPADPKKISADRSVWEYGARRSPRREILLGVPLYGHVWGQVLDTNHGLFPPGKAVPIYMLTTETSLPAC